MVAPTRRYLEDSSECATFAALTQGAAWDRRRDRSFNVARAIYLRLPEDARLWLHGKEESGQRGGSLVPASALKRPEGPEI